MDDKKLCWKDTVDCGVELEPDLVRIVPASRNVELSRRLHNRLELCLIIGVPGVEHSLIWRDKHRWRDEDRRDFKLSRENTQKVDVRGPALDSAHPGRRVYDLVLLSHFEEKLGACAGLIPPRDHTWTSSLHAVGKLSRPIAQVLAHVAIHAIPAED